MHGWQKPTCYSAARAQLISETVRSITRIRTGSDCVTRSVDTTVVTRSVDLRRNHPRKRGLFV